MSLLASQYLNDFFDNIGSDTNECVGGVFFLM